MATTTITTTCCYICSKPGLVEKLFNKCKHNSACYSCLQSRYIDEPQCVTSYPLECFHPDCRRPLRDKQLKRLGANADHIQKFYRLTQSAKINQKRLGEKWRQFLEIIAALGGEVCRCPKCGFLITKNGGCDHMQCLCGEIFSYQEACLVMEERVNYWIPPHQQTAVARKKKNIAPRLQFDHDHYQEDDVEELTLEAPSADHEIISAGSIGSVPTEAPTIHTNSQASVDIPSIISTSLLESNEIYQDFEMLEMEEFSTHHSETSFSSAWEEISEISSVVSLASTRSSGTVSFADAARRGGGKESRPKTMTELLPAIHENFTSLNKKPIQVEEDEGDFDLYSMYEGVKCSRGGKTKFMYNHQPKRKYRRRDQRQKSSWARSNDKYW